MLPGSTFAVVDLAGVTSENGVATALAGALQLATGSSSVGLLERVLAAVAESAPHVIAVNDVDHAPGATMRTLIAGLGPRTTTVCTARRPLGIDAEQVYRVAPLSLEDATALYVQRAERRGAQHTGVDHDALHTLVERLGALPLLIELAAARATTLPPRSLLDLIPRPTDAAHPQFAISIQSAWDLLTEAERDAACSLSTLPSSFDLDAGCAAIGTETAVRDLEALAEASWVQLESNDGDSRYRLLEPLRRHAEEHGGSEVRRAARRRLAHHFATKTHFAVAWTGRETVTLDQLIEWAPLLEKCALVPDAGDAALRCLCALQAPLLELGSGARLQELAERLLEHETAPSAAHTRLCLLAAAGATASGDAHTGMKAWSAIDVDAIEDPILRTQALVEGAEVLRAAGALKRAEPLAAEAVEILAGSPAARLRARANRSCAILYSYLGDDERALSCADEAIRSVGSLGPTRQLGYGRMYKGLVLARMNQPHRAEVCHRRALDIARETGARRLERAALGSLATVLHQQGRDDEARSIWERVLELNRSAGDQPACVVTHINLGNLKQGQGALQAARAHYAWAAELAAEARQPHRLGVIRFNLGATLHQLGRIREAMANYRAARAAATQVGRIRLARYAEMSMAIGELALGDRAAAKTTIAQARDNLSGIGDVVLADIIEVVESLVHTEIDPKTLQAAHARLAQLEGTSPQAVSMLIGTLEVEP